ncbi:MAG TPA: hypothetical protein VK766_02480 [Cytophagaceae bacterium]|jgi:hypothetical protein|nr:hypothetical protein [Cytophagaceae bacterium]
MEKSAFAIFASLCIFVFSSCKKDYTCNCTYSTSITQTYTGTAPYSTTATHTKDTSYTYTDNTQSVMFKGTTKAKISAEGDCNTFTDTYTYYILANSASSLPSSYNSYTYVPTGQVNVGTYVVANTNNCSLSK